MMQIDQDRPLLALALTTLAAGCWLLAAVL